MSEEIHPPLSNSEEKQLCVSCAAPNEPSAHFCIKCGAPLSSYASTAPFESQFAQGAALRHAAERPQRFIVVLGVWLIFGTIGTAGLALREAGRDGGFVILVLGAFAIAISIVMIVKTTKNYFSGQKADQTQDRTTIREEE